ncbi:MAG: hypothetical protein JOY57_04350, partial [Actinobacteria bacterium]|nr:hypothetical protein [Actinomycetota bacterium]
STSGPFPIIETRTVESAGGDRCRVNAVVEGDAGGFFRVFGPLLRAMVKRSVSRDYAGLAGFRSLRSGERT